MLDARRYGSRSGTGADARGTGTLIGGRWRKAVAGVEHGQIMGPLDVFVKTYSRRVSVYRKSERIRLSTRDWVTLNMDAISSTWSI
jgi:hypothetical protein